MLDGAESSFLDLRDPSHLDFEYHQQMDAVLAALRGEGGPLRALHLGGAGCALARAWDVTHPGSQQVAVEIDEILASQVRTWFDLPRSPRLRIRVGDAAEVVAGLRPGQWDVVVRDVFNGGSVPASCRSGAFMASCLEALAPGGLLLNVRALPALFLCTVSLDAFDEQVFPCGWAFHVRSSSCPPAFADVWPGPDGAGRRRGGPPPPALSR